MAVGMKRFVRLSLGLLLVILPVPRLALGESLQCLSSSCITDIDKEDSAIGQHARGLGGYRLSVKWKEPHGPNVHVASRRKATGDRLRLTIPMGMSAELIRHQHASSGTNSSQIFADVKRSLARGKYLRAREAKGQTKGEKEGSADRPQGIHTDVTSDAPFEYLMKISIGSPPQHLVAVADTGSDLVWLQCAPAPGTDEQQHFFDASSSKTFSKLACNSKPCHLLGMQYSDWVSCRSSSSTCGYSYFYADNSNTTGDLAMDTIHMKSSSLSSIGQYLTTSVHNVAFGCGQSQYSTSMLYMNANGVVGLGKGALSFPSQLGAQYGRSFSYCLVDREESRVKSSPMLFGSIAVPTVPGIQYTPFLDNSVYPTYYYIGLERIDVGGEALDIPPRAFELSPDRVGEGGTVIDSGTTFTQLVEPAYSALLRALGSRIDYKRVAGYFDFCHDVTDVPRNRIVVPRISLHFQGGAKFDLPFKNAFIVVPDDPVEGQITMCLAMNNSTDLGFTILGNYQQSNYHILYDLQGKRLGFVPRQCG